MWVPVHYNYINCLSFIIYTHRYNGEYKVKLIPKNCVLRQTTYVRYGYISCKDNDISDAEKLSQAKQASEGSFLVLDEKTVVHANHVLFIQAKDACQIPKYVDHNSIIIAFTEEQYGILTAWNPEIHQDFNFREYVIVQFELKYAYFQRLHDALDNLPQNIVDRLIPITQHHPNSDDDVVYDKRIFSPPYEILQLDKICQYQALNTILSSESKCPLLVAGPFGTGKTRLLARAAFEILRDRDNKVLICAHHQASVDTFIEYFSSLKHDKQRPWYQYFIRVAGFSHRSNVKDANPDCFCTVLEANKLRRFRLVVTTLGFAPHLSSYKNGYFTHILIDEGAQTREPETVGPLSLANENTKIIIAGDHNQGSLYMCLMLHIMYIM